jgi:hypothetical protein
MVRDAMRLPAAATRYVDSPGGRTVPRSEKDDSRPILVPRAEHPALITGGREDR